MTHPRSGRPPGSAGLAARRAGVESERGERSQYRHTMEWAGERPERRTGHEATTRQQSRAERRLERHERALALIRRNMREGRRAYDTPEGYYSAKD